MRCRLSRWSVVKPVTYHLAANGQIDFLEVKPAANGAAADRFSPFANWTKGLSVAQVQARLARAARGYWSNCGSAGGVAWRVASSHGSGDCWDERYCDTFAVVAFDPRWACVNNCS